MESSLDDFGTIVTIVTAILGALYSLIKISEWYGEKHSKTNKPPKISLGTNQGLVESRTDVDIFSVYIENTGKTTAESVEVRLYQVQQNGMNKMPQSDRYILHQFDIVKAGDNIPFNFIHDNRRVNQLITPAGNDRKFDRIKTHFTFQITGANFEPIIQQMTIELDKETNRFQLKKLMPNLEEIFSSSVYE